MSDQITQTLGFDASQCFAELTKLDGAMVVFENRLKSTASTFTVFNKSAGRTVNAFIQLTKQGTAAASAIAQVAAAQGNMAPAANAQAAASAAAQLATAMNQAGIAGQSASVKIGDAMVRIGKRSQDAANQVNNSTNRMTTSLQLLSRIVFTQFIVRALSQLRNAFRDTTQDAIAFQRQLSLIQTIDNSGASLENLSGSIREVADNLGLPILDVAAGAYQSISNQVGEFGESLELTVKAGQFAIATNSNVADSVDLLSAALKSYQLDVSETDRVSSVFFKTVDLGRISASELANSFGRVGPVAAELGLSLEELNGSLAAITVRGSKTSEALTQVRAITTALLKPSKRMAAVLAEMGFSSGESAIKTLGLAGTLSALETATAGSTSQMAKLFPNVRGLAGVASLTGDDLKSLTSNIREMESVSKDFAKEKFLQATANDAAKVTKEVNKLKDAFTVDLGQALLKTIVNMSDFVGGADSVANILRIASPAVIGLGASIGVLGGQLALANLAGLKLARSLKGLAAIPFAVGVGESIADFINKRVSEANTAAVKALEEANKEQLKAFTEGLGEKRKAANEADQERLTATRKLVAELNKVYLQDVANAQEANDKLVSNATNGLGRIVDAREGLVGALAKASSDAVAFARDSQSRISGLGELQGDRAFEFKTSGLSEAERVLALTKRANEIAQNAAQFIQNGSILGDEKQIENGVRLFEKAQQTGEAALSAAGNSSDAQKQVYNQLRGITTLQISAEQQLIETQKQRFQQIEAERKKQREITDEIKRQTEIALENTGEFDSQGNQFSLEDQLQRQVKRQNALKEIAKSALTQGDLSASGALGIADFVSRFQSELSKSPIQVGLDIEQASAKIKGDLSKSFEGFKLKVGVDIERLSEVVGRDLVTPDQVAQAQEEATKLAAEIRKKIDDAMAVGAKASDLQAELDAALAGVDATASRRGDVRNGQIARDANAEFNSITQMLEGIIKKGDLTKESLQTVIDKRNEFSTKIAENDTFLGDLSKSFSTGIEQLDNALRTAQQLIDLQAKLPKEAPATLNEQLARLDSVLGKDPAGQFSGAQQAMAGSVSSAQAIATAWERSAAAAERAAKAAAAGGGSGGSATKQAFGGMMHLAAGGAARGIDTIPAMLSPGEFVMNSKSSRKFYAQLQAMNAGQMPAYREQGGSVTNVGDTTINVNGGDPVMTGREVVRLINRAQRQGINRIQ